MRLNVKKAAGLLLIATGAVVAGVYVFNAQQGKRAGIAGAPAKAAPALASISAPRPELPPSHPPLAKILPPPGADARGGTVSQPELPPSHPPLAKVTPPPGAAARAGSVQVDPTRAYTHFRVGNNSVIAIYADATVMWLGTSGGIVRYDTVSHEFKTYDARDGLHSNGILYLGKLQGNLAVGTHGGGLSLLDQNAQRWDHYNVSEGLGDAFVYDVLEAIGGDVWIATGSGVNRVRGGALKDRAKWELFTVENTGGGLPHNRVYRLASGRNGSIWFATRGGLANLQNGKWATWTHAQGLGARNEGVGSKATSDSNPSHVPPQYNPNHIAALEVGKDGKVWAGTRGAGLARFDGKAWTNYTMAEGLPSNHIATLNFDRDGRLWVGTKNGLALFKDGKFQVMTAAHGLLGENVLSVTTAGDGGMWVGGFGGVAHIRRPAVN